jgi:hypothetical protein
MLADLAEKGRHTEALDILSKAAALFSDDEDIRGSVLAADVAAGNGPAVAEVAAKLDDSVSLQQEFAAEVEVPPAGNLAATDGASAGPGALRDPAGPTAGKAVGEEPVEADRWIANLAAEHAEVDLTAMLDAAKSRTAQHVTELASDPPTEVPKTLVASEAVDGLDIDGVFEHFRNEASLRAGHIDAEGDYERGVALREAGQIEESIQALRASSRAPQQRFRAAAALGRIYQQRNDLPQAIEWFERAAEAPPSSPDEAFALFYELAESLESVGEVARALAICLELQAEAGRYRDLSERIARLSKAQGGGQS